MKTTTRPLLRNLALTIAFMFSMLLLHAGCEISNPAFVSTPAGQLETVPFRDDELVFNDTFAVDQDTRLAMHEVLARACQGKMDGDPCSFDGEASVSADGRILHLAGLGTCGAGLCCPGCQTTSAKRCHLDLGRQPLYDSADRRESYVISASTHDYMCGSSGVACSRCAGTMENTCTKTEEIARCGIAP